MGPRGDFAWDGDCITRCEYKCVLICLELSTKRLDNSLKHYVEGCVMNKFGEK